MGWMKAFRVRKRRVEIGKTSYRRGVGAEGGDVAGTGHVPPQSERANRWLLDEAEKRGRTATLFVANQVSDLIAARFAANTLRKLNDTPDVFVRALKAGLYREILVLEEYETDRAGGWRPRRLGGPAPYLVTETLAERVFTPLYAVRVTRFIGYRKPDGTLVTAASEDPQVQLKTGFATEDDYLRYRLSLYP